MVLKNISLKVKIYAMGGILILTLGVSVVYALIAMNRIGTELTSIVEKDIPLTNIVTDIMVHQLEQAINFEKVLRFGAEMQDESFAAKHYDDSIKKFRIYSHQIDEEIVKGEKIAEDAMVLAYMDADIKEFKHIGEILKKVEKAHIEFVKHAEHAFELITRGKLHEAFVYAEKVEKEEEIIDHELESLLIEIEEFTESAAITVEHNEQEAFINLIFIAVIGSVFSTIMALLITSSILRGVNTGVDSAKRIADGDLTQEIYSDSTDEIGTLLTALGVMRTKLHEMITGMNHASTELAASSEELSSVSEETNRGIHTQQGEIQQAATAMNEMSVAVQEVASNAQLTSDSANDANKAAQQGLKVVKDNVNSIQLLAGVVENASDAIKQVGQDSDNIGTVLDVIKGIAQQTNLLALNAAIEAARAGEQGRGFAVVADEVRTLAQRTQESTAEIEDMISRLQASSANAVSTMDMGREQATKSVEQAEYAGQSLETITKVVCQINDMNTQIASAAEEQTSVSEEVNRNVTVISQVAEQNAAAVNQITASSEELARMAQNLQSMIAQFDV